MDRITTIQELRAAIRDLEHQNYVNEQHMRGRVVEFTDRLKPANVVKGLLKMAAGIATSIIVKKFFKKGLAVK